MNNDRLMSCCDTCRHFAECTENHWAITYDKDGVTCDHYNPELLKGDG